MTQKKVFTLGNMGQCRLEEEIAKALDIPHRSYPDKDVTESMIYDKIINDIINNACALIAYVPFAQKTREQINYDLHSYGFSGPKVFYEKETSQIGPNVSGLEIYSPTLGIKQKEKIMQRVYDSTKNGAAQ